jgi:hypothetical protein
MFLFGLAFIFKFLEIFWALHLLIFLFGFYFYFLSYIEFLKDKISRYQVQCLSVPSIIILNFFRMCIILIPTDLLTHKAFMSEFKQCVFYIYFIFYYKNVWSKNGEDGGAVCQKSLKVTSSFSLSCSPQKILKYYPKYKKA